jgi:hypothetical protein
MPLRLLGSWRISVVQHRVGETVVATAAVDTATTAGADA